MITFPITDPTWIFFLVLSLILFVPMLLERLRIPSIVGLIGAGILVGPYGLDVLEHDASFELFGKVGLYYIMFLASLEMNMQEVQQIKGRALVLGVLSFACPFVLGLATNQALDYSLAASVLMAAMYASHTLLSYPIVLRFGLSRRKSVSIATGGTIVADTLTLIVLAVVGGILQEETTSLFWVLMVAKILAIGFLIIFFFPRMGRWFFRRYDESVAQFIFVLVLVFAGAGLMQLAGMEGILGAFLVGIVLNKSIPPSSPLMSHIEFVGNSIFIPYFLIGVGMIINVGALTHGTQVLILAPIMVAVCSLGKWLAAFLTQKIFKMSAVDRTLIFGLTNSRAAATLAVVLVGHNILLDDGTRLLDETVLNAAMLLILCTCIISPFVTERVAHRIAKMGEEAHDTPLAAREDKILIAVSNPDTLDALVHLALYLRTPKTDAAVAAVNVILEDKSHLRQRGEKELERAKKIAAEANASLATHNRWAVNVVNGIAHTMYEIEATDLLLGLHRQRRLGEAFFGKVTQDLIETVPRQLLIYFPALSLGTIRHIHLLVPREAEFEHSFGQWAHRVALLSRQLSCAVDVYGGRGTMKALGEIWTEQKHTVRHADHEFRSWHDLISIAHNVRPDHMIVFIAARKGTVSHQPYMETLPNQIGRYFSVRNLLIIYPAQEVGGDASLSSRSAVPIGVR